MKLRDLVPRRSARRGRPTGAAAIVAALALAAMPAGAAAQGADDVYGNSPPPTAGGADDPTASDAPSGGGGGETFGSAAEPDSGSADTDTSSDSAAESDTVTDASEAVEQLPVTGLPALPVAAAGLVMLLLGSLGLRRFSGKPASKRPDPDDPSGTRRILER